MQYEMKNGIQESHISFLSRAYMFITGFGIMQMYSILPNALSRKLTRARLKLSFLDNYEL